ncbi:MAG: division/cell wall cluster transcriptional repressor MraZ [Dehalococcoidia bacterium]|nr:division/cell wall cluster transcriptional repressor MraZ [Dehalococcoidia bacterium]
MFLGTYEYKIDEKGRTPLPPRFREQLHQGMVMTQGLEKCITVYPLEAWQNIADRLAAQSANRSKTRRISRFTFATAFMTELDAQGRIAIPPPLRRYAGIGDAAVIAGVNTHFEIWSRENWEAESELMENEAWQISEGIEDRT